MCDNKSVKATHATKIATLKAYAQKHYNTFGHWFVETYDDSDYVELLQQERTVSAAKAEMVHRGRAFNEASGIF